jgi:thiamine-phosphate diphosphorylase
MSKADVTLYAITDRGAIGQRDFYEAIEAALKGGATILQLREKSMDEDTLIAEAKKAKKICAKYSVPLIINDNYKAAIAAGADGVHVGIEDAPVDEIRRLAGKDFIIGATAKTVEQAKAAQAAGADYLGVGAVFPSPTKKNAIRITNEQLREIVASVDIPVTAIGGISKSNMAELKGCGADGCALVSAIFAAEDIEAECRELKKLSQEVFAK